MLKGKLKKKDSSGKTIFHSLKNSTRILILIGFTISFIILYSILQYFGSDWKTYDCVTMLLGIIVTILCTGPYIEYSPIQCINVLIGVILYAKMAQRYPIQYTYLIYQIYALFCVVQALINIINIYKKQKQLQ